MRFYLVREIFRVRVADEKARDSRATRHIPSVYLQDRDGAHWLELHELGRGLRLEADNYKLHRLTMELGNCQQPTSFVVSRRRIQLHLHRRNYMYFGR